MSEEWPADPTDPRCPECGEPVSATATYCLHCTADLPTASEDRRAAGDDRRAAVSDPRTAVDDGRGSADSRPGSASGWEPASTDDERSGRGWLHPDSLLDDVSTGLVAVVAGLVAGVAATVQLLFALPDAWPFAVGVVVWLLATGWVARTRTVFGAARKGGYLVGGLLAALPLVLAITVPMQADTVGNRLVGAVVFGIFVWPFALAAAGVGYAAGAYAGDDAATRD